MAAKIIVVDDDASVCESVSRILFREKYEVQTCLSAKEAIRLLEDDHFDAVITDMMMPGMSGLDLLKEVKRRWPAVNVVIITGYATVRTAVQAIKWGAFDYIPKPFSMDEMTGVAARAIARSDIGKKEEKKEKKKSFATKEKARPTGKKVPPVEEEALPSDMENVYSIHEHCWAKVEKSGVVRIGIDAMYLRTVKDVVYVDFPLAGDAVEQGRACVKMTSKGHNIFKMWSPVCGEVVDVNENVERNMDLMFDDPYGKGWLLRVKPARLEEDLANLTEGL